MDVYARVTMREREKIRRLLWAVYRRGRRDLPGLVKQAGTFALQSASKATPPGKGTNVKRLPLKYRFRPTARLPKDIFWYAWKRKGDTFESGGNIFRSDRRLRSGERSGRLLRIKWGIKYWSKKKRGWDYLPILDVRARKPPKYMKEDKRARIPNAGAAKYAWLGSLGRLQNKNYESGNIYSPSKLHELKRRKTWMKASNLVKYAGKIAPRVVNTAIYKARRRLQKVWGPKLKRRMVKAS